MEKSVLPIEEIVRKYSEGMKLPQLAKEYGVLLSDIREILRNNYVAPSKEKKSIPRIELPIEEIVTKYYSGSTLRELAVEYKVSTTTIRKRIIDYYKARGEEPPPKERKRGYKKRRMCANGDNEKISDLAGNGFRNIVKKEKN